MADLENTVSEIDEYTLSYKDVMRILHSSERTVIACSDSSEESPGHIPNHQRVGPSGRYVTRTYRPADIEAILRRGFK